MRAAEIVVGQRYAYAAQYDWVPRYRDQQTADEVEVLEVGVKRRGTSQVADGVRVRFVRDRNNRYGVTSALPSVATVPSRDIRELWLTYEPRHAAEVQAKADKAAQQDREVEEIRRRILDVLPEGYDMPTGSLPAPSRGVGRKAVGMSFRDFAGLLEAAYTHGGDVERNRRDS